jgi:opine dehydrogenase
VRFTVRTLAALSRLKHEHWIIWPNITSGVAAFVKALDRERMAVVEAYALKGRTVEDYFHNAFGVPKRGLVEMFGDLERKLKGPVGPQVFEHRFILEDVPYALVFFLALGRVAGVPMPVTDACVTTTSAIFSRDFRTQNEIINALRPDSMSAAQICARRAGISMTRLASRMTALQGPGTTAAAEATVRRCTGTPPCRRMRV